MNINIPNFITPERSKAAFLVGLIVLQHPQDPKKVKNLPDNAPPELQQLWMDMAVDSYEQHREIRYGVFHAVATYLDPNGTIHYIKQKGAKRETVSLKELEYLYHAIELRFRSDLGEHWEHQPDGSISVPFMVQFLPFDPKLVGLDEEPAYTPLPKQE